MNIKMRSRNLIKFNIMFNMSFDDPEQSFVRLTRLHNSRFHRRTDAKQYTY